MRKKKQKKRKYTQHKTLSIYGLVKLGGSSAILDNSQS
jgi:hypothetical protein